MGTIAEKLTYLNGTKSAIKEAITNKGVAVGSSDTFRSYADKISKIGERAYGEYHLYYLEFTEAAEWVKRDGGVITAGQVITLKSGRNVAESNADTADYVPALTFDGWSSPFEIVNNTITIPTDIDQDVMIGAMYYTSDGNSYYVTTEGVVSTTQPTSLLYRVYLSNSVARLSNYQFKQNYSLRTFTAPHGTSLSNGTFMYTSIDVLVVPSGNTLFYAVPECLSLKYIILPNGIQNIAEYAFNQAYPLRNIILPLSVTKIGQFAFNALYPLRKITLPSSVTSISNNAFCSCYSMSKLTVKATTPPALSNVNAFDSNYLRHIYVPAASVAAYKVATNWSTFADIIEAIPNS